MLDREAFSIAAVLSCVTGRLMTAKEPGNGIEGVYEVLNYMTGESVYTHQLPRICREAVPVILALHPTLQQAIDEADQVTPANWREWLSTWEDRYGPTIAVPKFTPAEHESIDALSELAEMVHPDNIVVVKP